MPELPEVETIRQQLLPLLPLSIKGLSHSQHFNSLVRAREFTPEGLTLVDLQRKGKCLVFVFKNSLSKGQGSKEEPFLYMISQLGMSGSWRVSQKPITVKHTHFQLQTNKAYIAYVDPRRFGRLTLVRKGKFQTYMDALGVDIASDEFTGEYIYQVLQKAPNRAVKVFLLEQKYFAGIGNYIASEICARARILPTRLCRTLTLSDCLRMEKATRQVLQGAIKSQGTTFHGGYHDTTGSRGEGVQHLVVFYQKTCQLCRKNPVQKIVLGGRGTYFCNRCQR